MRIIAGKLCRRQLKSVKGMALRPTSDKLRETLFNVLGELVVDARFMDLFAGTGAVGIEALSRGARRAIFVEKNPTAVAVIRENLAALGLENRTEVFTSKALPVLERISAGIVFLDPPYEREEEYESALTMLGGAENELVVVQHSS